MNKIKRREEGKSKRLTKMLFCLVNQNTAEVAHLLKIRQLGMVKDSIWDLTEETEYNSFCTELLLQHLIRSNPSLVFPISQEIHTDVQETNI